MPRMSYSALDTDGTPTADPRDDIVRRLLAQQGGGKAGAWAPSAMDGDMKAGYTTAPMVRGDDNLTPGQKIQIASDATIAGQDARNGGDPGVRYANRDLAINGANEMRRDITNLDTPDILAAKRDAALVNIQSGTVADAAGIARNDLSRIQDSNKATIARQIAVDGGFLTDKDRRSMARSAAGLGDDADEAALRAVRQQLVTQSVSDLNSPVPAVRQAAAARLRKAGVDAGDASIGPKGDPEATKLFVEGPRGANEIAKIVAIASKAHRSFRPEIAAQNTRAAIMEFAEKARQAGADPDAAAALAEQAVLEEIPESTFFSNPISTLVPGLTASRDAFREALRQ